MSKVAITGVNGFIGGVIATSFLEKNYNVIGCASTPSPLNEKQDINLVKGRFQEEKVQEELLRETDILVHCAGQIYLQYGVNPSIIKINCEDSVALAQKAIDKGVKHFVYIGSIHAFQDDLLEIDKDSKLESNPEIAYNYSKSKAIQALIPLFENTNTLLTIICPTAVLGAYNYKHGSLMRILDLVDQSPVVFLPKAAFDVVDVEDIAASVMTVVENQTTGMYIGGGYKTSMKEVCKEYLQQTGRKKVIIEMNFNFLLPVSGVVDRVMPGTAFSRYNMNTLYYGTRANIKHDTEHLVGRKPNDIKKIISTIVAWKSA